MQFKNKSNRIRRHIKHFKKKRIDFAKYIDDFYIDSGVAYISCNVNCIKQIIHSLSVDGYEILNSDFVDFIEENSRYIPVEYPILLEICGGMFSAEEQSVITETIGDHFALRLGDAQLALDNNMGKSIRLFIMGVLFFVILSILEKVLIFSGIFMKVIDVIFWFFLWECGDVIWLDRHDLLTEKTMVARLASIKVVFKDSFKDDHNTEAVTNKIISEVFHEREN